MIPRRRKPDLTEVLSLGPVSDKLSSARLGSTCYNTRKMHYEINVAFKGQHWFATHPRSIMDDQKLKHVLKDIVTRFTSTDWEITVSVCHETGKDITDEAMKLIGH